MFGWLFGKRNTDMAPIVINTNASSQLEEQKMHNDIMNEEHMQLEKEIESLHKKSDVVTIAFLNLKEKYEQQEEQLGEVYEQLDQLREEKQSDQELINEQNIELQELRDQCTELSNIIDKYLEKYPNLVETKRYPINAYRYIDSLDDFIKHTWKTLSKPWVPSDAMRPTYLCSILLSDSSIEPRSTTWIIEDLLKMKLILRLDLRLPRYTNFYYFNPKALKQIREYVKSNPDILK